MGSRKGTFQINAPKRSEFHTVKKTTCLVLLFKKVCYSPLFGAFFEKVPFPDSHSFGLNKTFFDDTFFGAPTNHPNVQ